MGLFDSFIAGAAGGATISIIIKAYDEYSKEVKTAQQAIDSAAKAQKLAYTAAFSAVAGGAIIATKALYEFSIEAGKAEAIGHAFSNMYGTVAPDALRELTAATNGTVSQVKLMTAANQALLLGIDQKALPEMFKGAYAVSQATGRPVADAINDISLGIARQSKLILDNLGIIVDVDTANNNYAASLGKTASSLTDVERKIAFTNAAMAALDENQKKVGLSGENMNTNTQQLSAAWDNFTISLGETVQKGGIVSDFFTSLLTNITDLHNAIYAEMEPLPTPIIDAYYKEQAENKAKSAAHAAEQAAEEMKLQERLARNASLLEVTNQVLHGITAEQQVYNRSVDDLTRKFEENNMSALDFYMARKSLDDAHLSALDAEREKTERLINMRSPGDGKKNQTHFAGGASSGPQAVQLANGTWGAPGTQFNDFVMRPGGPPISFSSEDTIIGMKQPGKFGGAGTTMNIYIDSVQGLNADAVATALEKKLLSSIVA